MGFEESCYLGYGREAIVRNSLQYLEEGLEVDESTEAGRRVITELIHLVQDYAVSFFERVGVEPVGDVCGQQTGNNKGGCPVYPFLIELVVMSGHGAKDRDQPARALSTCKGRVGECR